MDDDAVYTLVAQLLAAELNIGAGAEICPAAVDAAITLSSSEDVNALWVAASGDLHLSTVGNFAVNGVAGANEDIFVFRPATLGPVTTGAYLPDLYLDGSRYGLASFALDAYSSCRSQGEPCSKV